MLQTLSDISNENTMSYVRGFEAGAVFLIYGLGSEVILDPVLMIILFAACTIGSFVRIADENSEAKLKKSKMLAIYSCAILVGAVLYLLASEGIVSTMIAALITIVGSGFALEIYRGIRYGIPNLVNSLMKGAATIILGWAANKAGVKPKDDNDDLH